MDVVEAITSRHSVRAFLPRPVPRETVERIIEVAARAPSSGNIQPWKVHVMAGETKDRFSQAILEAREVEDHLYVAEYQDYPNEWREPYDSRRRTVGKLLYGAIGIPKGDREAMWKQFGRNYTIFDAPVGLLFTIDRDMGTGSWFDVGMFIQNFMLLARAEGLDTCAQGAFALYHKIARKVVGVSELEIVMCGMSLGYADPEAPENNFPTERVPLEEFATFSGF